MSPYTINNEETFKIPAVAQQLQVTPSQVRYWVLDRRFPHAEKDDGGRWRIPASDIAAFAAGRRQRGRPRRRER